MMAEDENTLQRRRMVTEQISRRGLIDPALLAAMEWVPRECFVQVDDLAWAFSDGPLLIGEGQTISQPYIVALMTHLLQLKPTSNVLEVGTGSGYQAAVLAELAQHVHTVELIPALFQRARQLLDSLGYQNIFPHLGDGSLGWQENAPYDGIIVTAAGPDVPPPLLDQLAEDGRLVIPVGGRAFQVLEVFHRVGKRVHREQNISVAFVPLRGVHGWN
jgi:protein-L-isoaspartate(D-aspartate) O-methyltransferase